MTAPVPSRRPGPVLRPLAAALLAAVGSIAACTKSETTTIQTCGLTCVNGGRCVNNGCQCPAGYEGGSCQTAWNSKFAGAYQYTGPGGTTQTVLLTASPNRPDLFATGSLGYDEVRFRRVDSLRFQLDSVRAGSVLLTGGSGSISESGRIIQGRYYTRTDATPSPILDSVSFVFRR